MLVASSEGSCCWLPKRCPLPSSHFRLLEDTIWWWLWSKSWSLFSAWEIQILPPTGLTQLGEIPVMENLRLCRNNRSNTCLRIYIIFPKAINSNLGQLNTQSKLQNGICTVSTLKEKHPKSSFKKQYIFFSWPCYSKTNLTENSMFVWVVMLHSFCNMVTSDLMNANIIYRICMNKTNFYQLVFIKHLLVSILLSW